jgi:hypothetical protein
MCERNLRADPDPALSLHGSNGPAGTLRPILHSKIGCEIGQTAAIDRYSVTDDRDILGGMIVGAHFLLYSRDPEADRAFFRDVLGFPAVDVGGGWLIFGMSPAELAIHPLDGEFSQRHAGHELLGGALYLMCDDLNDLMASLKAKSVQCTEVQTAGWGTTTTIPLPSGGSIGLYQPRHQTALNLNPK